jgi:uncharacterized protein (UPF0548 family)
MELSGIRLGRRSTTALDARLERAERSELTYDLPGCTLRSGPADGLGDRTFEREVDGPLAGAAAALRSWAAHRGIRAHVHPACAPIEEGATLLVVAPFGPVEMAVPVRVVTVVDEPHRYGFAYGTLTGHAEAGEELFMAEQVTPGRLRLRIRVQARPATVLARLATPLVTLLQRAAARRYLAAWAAAVPAGDGGHDPDR